VRGKFLGINVGWLGWLSLCLSCVCAVGTQSVPVVWGKLAVGHAVRWRIGELLRVVLQSFRVQTTVATNRTTPRVFSGTWGLALALFARVTFIHIRKLSTHVSRSDPIGDL